MSDDLTIEELARATGLTVRNIRAYQTKGLLSPPGLRGRTGIYGSAHLGRLRVVKEMQANGFSLRSIKSLLDAAPEGAEEELLRFEKALMAPWTSEEPEILTAAEIAARFGSPSAEVGRRAAALGVLRPLPDGNFEVRIPTLLAAAQELHAMGVTLERMLDVLERVEHNSKQVTKIFVDLFLEHLWRPFDQAGRPPERWKEVRESLEQIRPIASRVVNAAFAAAMEHAVEEAFSEELESHSQLAQEIG
ncbi:MAG TPA: MerR family transcriptional regulator [Actinomycetota bacterium]|nr:MerR family transcriptional regulator [Actinomycetota bacterium]